MTKKERIALGERIQYIRKELLSLTQVEFCKILRLKQAAISKLERGESMPTVETLLTLKKKSGKSTDWILTGSD